MEIQPQNTPNQDLTIVTDLLQLPSRCRSKTSGKEESSRAFPVFHILCLLCNKELSDIPGNKTKGISCIDGRDFVIMEPGFKLKL